ncbi:hypothetical protein P3T76_002847 [Phytophthora citrophthora]|uniref:Uncharacterized protein n=1 Tax=Phytophthora citrophthora TaxID=4793 RepID=A0AAD9GWD2_9STRA|nr:hypothetical protein P3T76_002847 [Phytophthora citrophthora]
MTHYQAPTMLDSLLQRFFVNGRTSSKPSSRTNKPCDQVSQETPFTREADVDGWVFLAEERHSEPGSKPRTYADVVATGRT